MLYYQKPPWKASMKVCRTCTEEKPLEEFGVLRSMPDGRRRECKPCRRSKAPAERATRAAWDQRNKDKVRAHQLWTKFRITVEQYDALWEEQQGLCAICGEPERERRNGKLKMLAVDHCHRTDQIRGLLCCGCNQGLGRFQDSERLLRSALAYINRPR